LLWTPCPEIMKLPCSHWLACPTRPRPHLTPDAFPLGLSSSCSPHRRQHSCQPRQGHHRLRPSDALHVFKVASVTHCWCLLSPLKICLPSSSTGRRQSLGISGAVLTHRCSRQTQDLAPEGTHAVFLPWTNPPVQPYRFCLR
jgi:hypothetical protein